MKSIAGFVGGLSERVACAEFVDHSARVLCAGPADRFNAMTISLEVMLLDWSETAKGGAKIVLQLPSPEDLEPFRKMTLAKRGVAGQRLAVAMVEIHDDESVHGLSEWNSRVTGKSGISVKPDRTVNPDSLQAGDGSTPSLPTEKGGALCKLAAILCNDPEFQFWISRLVADSRVPVPELMPPILGEESAAVCIRAICNISSRRKLDHDAKAAQVFHEQIREPWLAHQNRVPA